MKKRLQLEIQNIAPIKNNPRPMQVNTWVNTALRAKNNPKETPSNSPRRMLALNMTFCKSILGRR
ncbi:hypothetical protein [Aureispira anguillae]|uniref:Uncharacterized protein n=1 Tax=Aureispira anguillae TaxID=2864201 RepID=A0A915YEH6_9BACT|nr:hypothetical protein [Aureispira anguillae]BDS11645.1 hypothetical protein AsAng_0023590 [Aureispira anguillae]